MKTLRCGECEIWNCQYRLAPAYFCGDYGKLLTLTKKGPE